MKLKTRMLDDIDKKIIEVWDRGVQETNRYISHTTNYPETHHIDSVEVEFPCKCLFGHRAPLAYWGSKCPTCALVAESNTCLMEETYNETKKKDEDEAKATTEKTWENYKVSCKDCKSHCGI